MKQSAEETSIMWIPDIRLDAGLLVGGAIALVSASPVQAADNYVYGVCRMSPPGYGTTIGAIADGGSYLVEYHGNDLRYRKQLSSGQFFSDAKVTLIKAPSHGKVIREEGVWSSEADYQYWSNEGYAGKDRFVMQVEKEGVKVRIHYLMVVPQEGESWRGHCNPEHWKISTPTTGDTPALANVLTTAAGHGWYIDYTPYLNDKYLPTGNPLEWIAWPELFRAPRMECMEKLPVGSYFHDNGNRSGGRVYVS